MKNQLYKAALLAALGLGSISAAHAQSDPSYPAAGDLVIGFSSTAAGVTQDYDVDIGQVSALTVDDNLSADLSVSTLQSIFGANLAGVSVGVVGYNNDPVLLGDTDLYRTTTRNAGPYTPAYTSADSTTPTKPASNGAITTSAGDIASLDVGDGQNGINKGTSSSPGAGSWSDLIAQSSTTVAFSGTGLATEAGNPMGVLVSNGSGGYTLNLDMYEDNNSGTAGRTYVYQGYFNLDISSSGGNLSSDSFTYDPTAAVPEPGTYGLCAGAGLLLLGLRRQFSSHKSA